MQFLYLYVYGASAFLYRESYGDLEPEARFCVSGYDGRWEGQLFGPDFSEDEPQPIKIVPFKTYWEILKYCETAAVWHGCELKVEYAPR